MKSTQNFTGVFYNCTTWIVPKPNILGGPKEVVVFMTRIIACGKWEVCMHVEVHLPNERANVWEVSRNSETLELALLRIHLHLLSIFSCSFSLFSSFILFSHVNFYNPFKLESIHLTHLASWPIYDLFVVQMKVLMQTMLTQKHKNKSFTLKYM